MDISTVASTISTAIATLGQLREASKKVQNAELKTIIAELADQLSDAKLQLAELKDELVTLRAENQELKTLKDDQRPGGVLELLSIPWRRATVLPGLLRYEGQKTPNDTPQFETASVHGLQDANWHVGACTRGVTPP
jgi:hypothetical protein